jgi:hypothetical protein
MYMATNTILTDAKITKEALSVLHNSLGFVKNINRDYDGQFARAGAKIGQSINVRLPNRYTVQQGPAIIPQATTETSVALTLNRQWVVPMTFSSAELTLSIDAFSDRYIKPAIAKLASHIDYDCYKAAITGSFADSVAVGGGAGPVNFSIGTPGTTPGTTGGSAVALLQYNSPAAYLNAGRILDINGVARDKSRTVCIDPAANASSVAGLSGLFNPQGILSTQYRNGLMGNALGFDFVMDQNVYALTAGTQLNTTPATMQATWASGAAFSWTVDSSDNTKTLKAGSTFTVADCYHVNPETQQSTGVLMQWVVTAAVTLATGTNSISVSPTPIVAASGVANGNCSVAPTSGKAITMTSGTNATASPVNLAFHKEAFVLGTADMEIPPDVQAHRETMDGISIRFLRQYNAMSDFSVYRFDVLGGFAVFRPECAVRIAG